MEEVSVIIPTYQRRESLLRALMALSHQTVAAGSFEVVVVVDGSIDGTQEMLMHLEVPFRLRSVWQPNKGRAVARNQGIRHSAGELLILIDDDMEPAPTFIEAHLHAHHKFKEQSQVQGRVLCVLGAAPVIMDENSSLVSRYIGEKFNRHLQEIAQPGYMFSLRDYFSGNFSIPADILARIGGFDEEFKLYGNEDLELFFRLRASGVHLEYHAEVLANQYCDKDFPDLARDNLSKGKTVVLLVQKHPEAYPELKLYSNSHEYPRWRKVRKLLLAISRWWPAVPKLVLRLVAWMEKNRTGDLDWVYSIALDYFFWLGVDQAELILKRNGAALAWKQAHLARANRAKVAGKQQ